MSPTMNYFSSTLSFVAMIFYIIGAIGFSDNKDVIENVSWINVKQGGFTTHFALKSIYSEGGGFENVSDWSDCANGDNDCSKCEEDGKGAFALTIIGAVLALITMSACGTLSRQVSFPLQLVSILLAAATCAAGVISISLFMGDCYDRIDDTTNEDLEWGAGSSLTIIAMFLMAGACLIQILSTFCCKSA
eukprot:GDKK01051998.1.p1 GENE.GDKK01051998.1~~GDKK01051998.1.p1  ORF type:complete len:190 (+),score=34.40 GDKK01051998.1:72-641(+)